MITETFSDGTVRYYTVKEGEEGEEEEEKEDGLGKKISVDDESEQVGELSG